MRIGIDMSVVDRAREYTGISNYVRRLADSIASPARSAGELQNDTVELILLHPPKRKIPFFSYHWRYARQIRKQGIDLLHGPANVLPWFWSGRSVLTIHDLMIYRHPEWFPRGQWFAVRHLVPRSIRRANKIIVPSQTVKRDLQELFDVAEEKIAVIPLGVEERFFTPSSSPPNLGGEKRGYILFVGTSEPRKNLKGAIEAYRLLPEEMRAEHELWVAGARPPLYLPLGKGEKEKGSKIPTLEKGEKEGVRFLGHVPDADLPALYQNAATVVYPSFGEGFGLPVLEAMAAGTPVVTSKNSAMAEFAEGAAELIDPSKPEEIASAIAKLIRDAAYAREISATAVARAAQFTWEKTAQSTFAVYESA